MDITWYEKKYRIQEFYQNMYIAMNHLDKAIIDLQWMCEWGESRKEYINKQINSLHNKLNDLAFWYIDMAKYLNELEEALYE